MSNPFNQALDWALQGKRVEVRDGMFMFRGWVEKVHHNRGSLVLHDAERAYVTEFEESASVTWESIGGVFIRTAESAIVLEDWQGKTIENIDPEVTTPYPDHPQNFEPSDNDMRRAARNRFTGSFPVVRPLPENHEEYDINDRYQILNGHKRIEAAKRVGLRDHPMEVLRVTDEQAEELYHIAHRQLEHKETGEDVTTVKDLGESDGHQRRGSAKEAAEETDFESGGQQT